MRKTITLIIAAIMTAGLISGCGSTSGTTVPEQTDVVSEAPETAAAEKSLDLGTIDGDTYENSFLDLTFTLPEGWDFATDEELKSMMGAGSEVVFGDDPSAAEQYALESTVYDMMAYADGGTPNVIVMFENLSRYLGGTAMTEDDYIETVGQQLEDLEDMNYELGAVTDETFGSYDYKALTVSAVDYGVNQCYLVRRVGDYMMSIVITNTEEQPVDVLNDYFG